MGRARGVVKHSGWRWLKLARGRFLFFWPDCFYAGFFGQPLVMLKQWSKHVTGAWAKPWKSPWTGATLAGGCVPADLGAQHAVGALGRRLGAAGTVGLRLAHLYTELTMARTEAGKVTGHSTILNVQCGHGSKPMGSHFGIGAPPISCGWGCSLGVRGFDPWPCGKPAPAWQARDSPPLRCPDSINLSTA